MAKKPNYNHERRERERAKAAKKAAKADARSERKDASGPDDASPTPVAEGGSDEQA
jgi:hypothetical protein